MSKEDMIRLIEAEMSIIRLNDDISRITNGYPINNTEYKGIYNIYDIIFENSKYAEREDDSAQNEFRAIMYGIGLTAEERYELLKP